MNYLQQALELSQKSLGAGQFPAGAVLVTKNGKAYYSDPSLAHYHGECMVIDKAIEAEGAPLTGSVMYASMQSCLMCSSKMYWAGISEVHYIIPKDKTNSLYAYEDDLPIQKHTESFHVLIKSVQDDSLFDQAFSLYEQWVQKVESNK